MAGGGIRGGQVYGSSDRLGAEAARSADRACRRSCHDFSQALGHSRSIRTFTTNNGPDRSR